MSTGMLTVLTKARTKETLEKLYNAWKDSLTAKLLRLRSELEKAEAELKLLEETYRQLKKERGWE